MQKLIKNLNYIWNRFKQGDQDFWNEIEEQLILSDVSSETAAMIIKDIRENTFRENINDLELIKNLIKQKITEILSENGNSDFKISTEKPSIWLIVGVNGVGKTSTIAKIAYFFQQKKKSILFTAADTFRAAAYEQIDHFARFLNIPVVHHQRFSDPGAVVYDSIEKAVARNIDMILIDTAGRMHTSYNLMEELKKIKKVIFKKIGREPDEIMIVIDATTGQNARIQVSKFNEAVGLSGIILTKTDGTSKGGIILTIKNEFKIPIKFITKGENIEALEVFDPVRFTDMLFK
jgi:fused signal recognition particle receptor